MKARIALALLICVLALAAAEWWLRGHLFRHVSYSNSASIDRQLHDRDTGGPWTTLFVGDSEVHWGIDPVAFDAAFASRGVRVRSFNHAFDGFGASWWPQLLPALLREPSLREVRTVVVGVQLIDLHRVIGASGTDCGALQRPVLTSPLAVDLGVDGLCRSRSWDAALGRRLFDDLWTVRYASAVRTLLLPGAFFAPTALQLNSRSLPATDRGFQPHRTLEQDKAAYAEELRRWKAQFEPGRDFVPLAPGAWADLVAPGGFFDQLQVPVAASGRKLVLFALPTNPEVIDTFGRRADYLANSRLLARWAQEHGVQYVDLGIQDRQDADRFFSDMRHLSGVGAAIYSSQLGAALVPTEAGIARTDK